MRGGRGTAGNTRAGSPSRRRHAAGRWLRSAPRSLSPGPAARAGPARRGSPRTTERWQARATAGSRGRARRRSLSTRPERCGAAGQALRVGQPDEHLARSFVGLPAVRGANVVEDHEVAGLPGLANGVGRVDLVEQLHDVLADRLAVAVPGVE